MSVSSVLGDDECASLLRAGTFGRMAMTTPGGPEIVPVNYRVVVDEIVVRTGAASMLARWADQAQVSFEIDLVDYRRWVGWSVIARGVAVVEATEPSSPDTVDPVGPRPWVGGERAALVRLRWTSLSGRKLGRGWDALGAMPSRTTSL